MSSTPSAIPKSVQNTSFLDLLKPRYHEAVFRLRNTIVALVILFTLTHLLPLPTPYASLWKFYRGSFQSSWERSLAIAELSLFCLLLLNILQAALAIRSPPAPYPPLPSPSKPQTRSPAASLSKVHRATTTTPSAWRSGKAGAGALSPHTTPQRQLAFSTSTSAGAGPGAASTTNNGASASDPRGLVQSYVLAFNSPSSPEFSFASSTGSLPPSPSPSQALAASASVSPLAAYRGRRAPTGRALDGSLLARLGHGDSDSDSDAANE